MIFRVSYLFILLGLFLELAALVSGVLALILGMLPEIGPLIMNGMGIPGAILALVGIAGVDWKNRH